MRDTTDVRIYRRPTEGQLPFSVSRGDTQANPTDIVSGFLGCDARPFNPLLAALPRVIRASDGAGGALGASMRSAMAQAREHRIGGEGVLGHLSEVMFVDVVRGYLETLPEDGIGWLAGLRDTFVGRALMALLRDPARDWTLESLAHEVGLSRSALAE